MIKMIMASGNRGKQRELRELLGSIGADVELLIASDVQGAKDVLDSVEESGSTYEENALIKARAIADATGMIAIADDSGIEVESLGGAPGVRSARAWPGSDADRVAAMLDAVSRSETPDDRRAAFVCCIVIAIPDKRTWLSATGRCEGTLAREPRGSNGFGYDPIFIPDGETKTFAELPPETKSAISHRASAMRGVADLMPDVIRYASDLVR